MAFQGLVSDVMKKPEELAVRVVVIVHMLSKGALQVLRRSQTCGDFIENENGWLLAATDRRDVQSLASCYGYQPCRVHCCNFGDLVPNAGSVAYAGDSDTSPSALHHNLSGSHAQTLAARNYFRAR